MKQNSRKIINEIDWICENPSHYNDFLFSRLSQELNGRLKVHYMHASVKSHPWKSKAARSYNERSYDRLAGIDWQLLKIAATKKNGLFVIGGWFDKTAMLCIMILSLLGKPFMIWTDTPNLNKKRKPVFEKLRNNWINFVFKHACVVMGTGRTAIAALKQMKASEKKLVNLPYFIDPSVFVPGAITEKENNFVFLSSGRLDNSLKGQDLAIEALALVKNRIPGIQFLYQIAGAGPDKEKLEQLVKDKQLTDNVVFAGWLEISELPGFYQKGDIFLHPAHYEPYGVSVIEAMSCGLLVIGSDKTGAVIDRVIDGENGFIHADNDVDGLAAKICTALLHPANMQAMRIRSRQTAAQWPLETGIEIIKKAINICAES